MRGLYIIGEPGAGKSTLMAAITERWPLSYTPGKDERRGHPEHTLFGTRRGVTRACEIGGRRGKFPGTDRLSMSVQPKAIEFLATAPAPLFLGEGDRLATDGFFMAMEKECRSWTLVVLATDPGLCAQRRAERADARRAQNEAWVRGRATKVRRLSERWAGRALVVTDPEEIDLDRLVSPQV